MKQQPNIIMILSDQHRHDWMGYKGKPFTLTPNLDRLAADGVSFDSAYCNTPLCGPSRMSLLTGRHPYRNEVWVNEHTLRSGTPTFPHALGLSGYNTVLAGRMHFMNADQRHGFQTRLVGDVGCVYPGRSYLDYGRLAGANVSPKLSVCHDKLKPGYNPILHYDSDVTEAAVEYMNNYDGGKPLFMTVGFCAPHSPYVCDEETFRTIEKLFPENEHPLPASESLSHPWEKMYVTGRGGHEGTSQDIRKARINYAGMISKMDGFIGDILSSAEHLHGDTIILYVSDHGDLMGDHGCFAKCSMWEGSSQVPMIWANLKKPGNDTTFIISASKTVDVPVSLLDLSPTLISMVGAPTMPLQDGNSLLPLLKDPQNRNNWVERPVFSELEIPEYPPIRMVRRGNWKYTYFHGLNCSHLYNLEHDPDELSDLSEMKEYAVILQELKKIVLDNWNPDEIENKIKFAMSDLRYITQWGRKVGIDSLEMETWQGCRTSRFTAWFSTGDLRAQKANADQPQTLKLFTPVLSEPENLFE